MTFPFSYRSKNRLVVHVLLEMVPKMVVGNKANRWFSPASIHARDGSSMYFSCQEPGDQRIRSRIGEEEQNAVPAHRQNRTRMHRLLFRKYGSVTQKIARAALWSGALHGARCLGPPPSQVNKFKTFISSVFQANTHRAPLHRGWGSTSATQIHACRVDPVVGQKRCGSSNSPMRISTRPAAQTCGHAPLLEQSTRLSGNDHHVPQAAAVAVAASSYFHPHRES